VLHKQFDPITMNPPTHTGTHICADHSRFVQRVRRRYATELAWLAPGPPRGASILALVAQLQAEGRGLASAMRVARQCVLERLVVLDTEQGAPLAVITQAMTELAEATLELALTHARAKLDARHGLPLNAAGEVIDFWIVGMGKLGARELNVSSDIDLIYLYEETGHTAGTEPISAHEYFAHLAKNLFTLIGEVTEDGFVFRMDLALRPHGGSGPPAMSLAMLETYLQVHGREWERFAWLKSRVVAPAASVRSGRALPLRSLVAAFVYRRHLDYNVFEALRQLHAKVREDAKRRAAGRPERAQDVKLARGGIREIEFIVQLLLIARGGQFPELRTRSTLKALTRLASASLMAPDTAHRLAQAYEFLRRTEHRIQYLDDQQTHTLPTDEADLRWIAYTLGSLGFEGDAAGPALLAQLKRTREWVAAEFDALLHGNQPPATEPGSLPCLESEAFLEALPPELSARVKPLAQQPKVQLLRDDNKRRLACLIERAAQAVQEQHCTLEAATRFVDWLEPLLRRESYLAMLVERPALQNRLLRLLGLARWPMRYLMLHPSVMDELADDALQQERFNADEFKRQLQDRHAGWVRSGQADEEFLLDTLRRAHHAEVFRTLVRDVEGHLTVEQVADELSALADALLSVVMQWAWQHFKGAHRSEPQLAVVAYGKLGGKELGYGSDLDLVFVFDQTQEPDLDKAAEIYAAFVRKLIQWLSLRTGAGELFDIDTALRPNGQSGLLVTSMAAFEHYQTGRGSHTAWAWEHQALTRARWCAGFVPLAARFEAVRTHVLCAPRQPQALREEVQVMRDKVRSAHPVKPEQFDVKHSPGGMMDVEFAVQYLVLAHAATHPELLADVGNIALLLRAEAGTLLPPTVGLAAANAYRSLRRAQHQARLNEQPTQLPTSSLQTEQHAVLALWQAVFEAPL
jgi:[glutamine synthetase] adenylyltransferase / [glutamine synthetase]-adenylyl-L-tyrosine phosphorylase